MSTPRQRAAAVFVDARPLRLIVAEAAWAAACRALLTETAGWAVGALAWNNTGTARELLAESLQVVRKFPSGKERPPLAEWIAVAAADLQGSPGGPALRAVARSLQPRPAQLLVVLLIDRDNRGRWEAALFRAAESEPIDEVRLVGPHMLHLNRHAEPLVDAADILRRYSRTSGALGERVHRRLRQATVTLIGAGRNGAAIASQVSALGIGRLRIAEGDVLRLENLDATPGLTVADIGKNKAQALAARLLDFRPDLSLAVFPQPITASGGADFLRERVDLLITAVDNDVPRLAAARTARRTLTVHLDVSTSVQHSADGGVTISGDARFLLPSQGCALCVGGLADSQATAYNLTAPAGSLPRRLRGAWHEERAGSLITINAITVAAGVQAWLDLLAGHLQTSLWQRFAWQHGVGLRSDAGPVGAADDCRLCRGPSE